MDQLINKWIIKKRSDKCCFYCLYPLIQGRCPECGLPSPCTWNAEKWVLNRVKSLWVTCSLCYILASITISCVDNDDYGFATSIWSGATLSFIRLVCLIPEWYLVASAIKKFAGRSLKNVLSLIAMALLTWIYFMTYLFISISITFIIGLMS